MIHNAHQKRVISDFMDLMFDSKTILTDQQYLDICNIIQMTHSLVSIDIQQDIYIDGVRITPREWRAIKRSYYAPISQVMQSYDSFQRRHKRTPDIRPKSAL